MLDGLSTTFGLKLEIRHLCLPFRFYYKLGKHCIWPHVDSLTALESLMHHQDGWLVTARVGFEFLSFVANYTHTHIQYSMIIFTSITPFYRHLTLGSIDISLHVSCHFCVVMILRQSLQAGLNLSILLSRPLNVVTIDTYAAVLSLAC